MQWPSCYDILLVVGRITPSESLFYYDVANGLDYEHYNDTSSYSPAFDIQRSVTPQQQQEARQVCTVNSVLNTRCEYDYYATGNAAASSVTATTAGELTTAQDTLSSFVVLLALCLCQVRLLLFD